MAFIPGAFVKNFENFVQKSPDVTDAYILTTLLKEKGIESDQQATPQNGWWHFQKDEIRFETDELINQDSIREKIIESIKKSALYGNGLKIIECYTNH